MSALPTQARTSPSAQEVITSGLSRRAERLGVADPVAIIGAEAFLRGYTLSATDPYYARNPLTPGYLPIEYSFSELSPTALRFATVLLGPGADDRSRNRITSELVRRLVRRHSAPRVLEWLERESRPWTECEKPANAYFGVVTDASGLAGLKTYYVVPEDRLDEIPPDLLRGVKLARRSLEGLELIGLSLDCGRLEAAHRIYLRRAGELRLEDLAPMVRRLGLGAHWPGLSETLSVLAGRQRSVPSKSLVVGLGQGARGYELKLELLLDTFVDPPLRLGTLEAVVGRYRSQVLPGLRTWLGAMALDGSAPDGFLSVASVRLDPAGRQALAFYMLPGESRILAE